MSPKINAREVLSYLNQLGYTNINAVQLQAFMKDLKKLMKYEELKINKSSSDSKLVEVNIIRETISRNLCESEETSSDAVFLKNNEDNMCQSELLGRENIAKSKSSQAHPNIVSAPDKEKKKKPVNNFLQSTSSSIVCPVHLFQAIDSPGLPSLKSVGTACTCLTDGSSQISDSYLNKKNTRRGKRPGTSTIESKNRTTGTSSYPESFDDYARGSVIKEKVIGIHNYTRPCYCPESMRPQSAVIKCNNERAPPLQKCDPVNLYKYYQRQWKINKIPGENMSREKRFRWCLREKISCGPPVKYRLTVK